MRIGYACLTVNVPNTDIKRCRLKNANDERLADIIGHNLNSLENTLDYNMKNGIRLFRISSDLIPFGSSPEIRLPWWDIYEYWLKSIGDRIRNYGMRVSMHPGQYTILNAERKSIIEKSVDDLAFHTRVLDSMQLSPEHKIVLHVGGVYNNKKKSMERFIESCKCLSSSIRQRLVIENDDKCYSVKDILTISNLLDIPVVYDNLHNKVNPGDLLKSDAEWIKICRKTWHSEDGVQKIHYSRQAPGKSPGAHADSIRVDDFTAFFNTVKNMEIDIMLEVKDKNLSALKCIEAVRNTTDKNYTD